MRLLIIIKISLLLFSYILLIFICSIVGYILYLTIKDINENETLTTKQKNEWVFFVIYMPLIGTLIYNFKKKRYTL